jgi:hypothetical protein
MTKIFVRVSKWGLLFDEGRIGLSAQALRLLHSSSSMSMSALSWRPGHCGLCVPFVTAVAYLVEALCYKPEGRWFESRLSRWILN